MVQDLRVRYRSLLARTPLQLDRARAAVDRARDWGFGQEDYRLLSAAEARQVINVPDALGSPSAGGARLADPEERLTGRPSVTARTFSRLISG